MTARLGAGWVRGVVAGAAAAVLTQENQAGKIYELAGDEAYTLAEFTAEIARQSGKKVDYINLPEAEVKRRMVASTKRAVVVADGSKLGVASLGRIGGLDEFDSLITTGDASALPGSSMRVVIAT